MSAQSSLSMICALCLYCKQVDLRCRMRIKDKVVRSRARESHASVLQWHMPESCPGWLKITLDIRTTAKICPMRSYSVLLVGHAI